MTVDGEPGSLLLVRFVPEVGSSKIGQPVDVVTGTDGKFAVKMPEGNEGLPAGHYDVVFVWQQFGRAGTDRFNGAYTDIVQDPTKSPFKVTVEEGKPLQLPPFELHAELKK